MLKGLLIGGGYQINYKKNGFVIKYYYCLAYFDHVMPSAFYKEIECFFYNNIMPSAFTTTSEECSYCRFFYNNVKPSLRHLPQLRRNVVIVGFSIIRLNFRLGITI